MRHAISRCLSAPRAAREELVVVAAREDPEVLGRRRARGVTVKPPAAAPTGTPTGGARSAAARAEATDPRRGVG